VAAVRRGDDRAFEELYSRYGRRIVTYVLGIVGDHGRAEDIAQEVFISALRRMRATERPIAFKPWIYEIAKNASIDEFRRTRRIQEVPLASDYQPDAPAPPAAAPAQSPHASLERRQQLDDLCGAFRGLSDNHHKILVLRELEGLSYTEIGRRMGMTRPVVESTLFRARRRLGQEYEEIASGQRCEQVRAVIDAGGARTVPALGIRERRRLTRHVSHCQPCRRHAWLAGIDESVLRPPTLAEKVAALLPIPAFLRWRRGGADDEATTASSSHSVASLQSVQTALQMVGPGSLVPALGRAAAAVAAIAIAGGGVVSVVGSRGPSKAAPSRLSVAARSTSGPTQHHRSLVSLRGARHHGSVKGSGTRTSGGAATAPQQVSIVGRAVNPQAPSNNHGGAPGLTVKLPPLNPSAPPELQQLPKVQVPQLPQLNLPPVGKVLNNVPNPVKTVRDTLGLLK